MKASGHKLGTSEPTRLIIKRAITDRNRAVRIMRRLPEAPHIPRFAQNRNCGLGRKPAEYDTWPLVAAYSKTVRLRLEDWRVTEGYYDIFSQPHTWLQVHRHNIIVVLDLVPLNGLDGPCLRVYNGVRTVGCPYHYYPGDKKDGHGAEVEPIMDIFRSILRPNELPKEQTL